MVEDVKRKRPYSSPRHADMRARTRRDVLAAAQRLFAERGYRSTTIDAIAADAGVAVQTIYAAFGSKRAIVWALLETTLVGDDDPRSLIDRLTADLDGVTHPAERQARAARYGRQVLERTADIHRMMRDAASADPEIAAALVELEARRYEDACSIVDLVSPEEATAAQRRRAADVLFAVASYEVHDLLVVARGWSVTRWEQWFLHAITREFA
jgi:TetR/AcrR family transcriptional regulator of autoinduction and epiphytic fitness